VKRRNNAMSGVKRVNIKVAEVLNVGDSYFAGGSEEVTIKDERGNIWVLPEDKNYDKPGKRLVSRYDVKKGMRLRVVVVEEDGEKYIKEVIIIKGPD